VQTKPPEPVAEKIPPPAPAPVAKPNPKFDRLKSAAESLKLTPQALLLAILYELLAQKKNGKFCAKPESVVRIAHRFGILSEFGMDQESLNADIASQGAVRTLLEPPHQYLKYGNSNTPAKGYMKNQKNLTGFLALIPEEFRNQFLNQKYEAC